MHRRGSGSGQPPPQPDGLRPAASRHAWRTRVGAFAHPAIACGRWISLRRGVSRRLSHVRRSGDLVALTGCALVGGAPSPGDRDCPDVAGSRVTWAPRRRRRGACRASKRGHRRRQARSRRPNLQRPMRLPRQASGPARGRPGRLHERLARQASAAPWRRVFKGSPVTDGQALGYSHCDAWCSLERIAASAVAAVGHACRRGVLLLTAEPLSPSHRGPTVGVYSLSPTVECLAGVEAVERGGHRRFSSERSSLKLDG